MPPGSTVIVAHGGIGKLPGTRSRPESLRWRHWQGRILIYGCRIAKLSHPNPSTCIPSACSRNPPFHPSSLLRRIKRNDILYSRLLVCRIHSMQPEERQCSSFSLVCMLLGAYLCFVLCHLITNLSSRVDVDLDIPAIAAIGWQSAGKSSLIEAISGITLPRASGTCTR
jgi:hypothetical protein